MTLPSDAFQQAMQHHRAGRLAEAERLYRQAVAQQPNNIPAWGNLGIVLQTLGKPADAAESFRQITVLQPTNAQAFNHLGLSLGMAGRLEESAIALQTATRLDPSLGMAFSNLSNALRQLGRLEESEHAARRAVELDPRDSSAFINLAATRIALNRHAEAIDPAERAAALEPNQPLAHYNLGLAYAATGQLNEAVAALKRAAHLAPNHMEVQKALLRVMRDVGQFTDALAHAQWLLADRPNEPTYHHHAATILSACGQVPEAIAEYERALELDPSMNEAGSSLLLAMHYQPRPPREMFEAHLAWAKRHTAQITAMAGHRNDTDPDRPLRIGYVSPDFRRHSVAQFLDAPLRSHDRSRFQIYLYSDVQTPDNVTTHFKSLAAQFRNVFGMSDARFCDLVRGDEIDILIDCAGHTGGNRLIAFAQKPAPVQVTYLGYPDTTGLRTIDYRITDAIADPSRVADELHVEELVQLPIAWCYTPPEQGRDAQIGPRPPNEKVTFGSFNTIAKLSPQWMEMSARILRRVPGSRLVVKSLAFRDEGTMRRMRDVFAAHGIADQLELLTPHRELSDHFAAYGEVDIALDSFPYHGTTTTCDAMWMGVPVVALAGDIHVSRVAASLLAAIGLNDLVATTPQQYEDIAVALADNRDRRQALRSSLRERMRTSPLMDAERYTRSLESAYRDMWRAWCAWRAGDE